MDRLEFQESLLNVMENKVHWAWPGFTSGLVPRERLHIHLEQEYESYVRDFPVLVGRAYVQCPIAEVRRELAENLYEEETGGIAAGRPHPELFLEYPKGLNFNLKRFQSIELLPAAKQYRRLLDDLSQHHGWEVATTIVTLFIEGTPYERGEIEDKAAKRPSPPLEEHPLVKHYDLPVASLALTKAHRTIEGEHRASAWRMILDSIPEGKRSVVVDAMRSTLNAWLAYRDDVAYACGLQKDSEGKAVLSSESSFAEAVAG